MNDSLFIEDTRFMIKFVLGAQGFSSCCQELFHLTLKQQRALATEESIECPFCKKTITLLNDPQKKRRILFGSPRHTLYNFIENMLFYTLILIIFLTSQKYLTNWLPVISFLLLFTLLRLAPYAKKAYLQKELIIKLEPTKNDYNN